MLNIIVIIIVIILKITKNRSFLSNFLNSIIIEATLFIKTIKTKSIKNGAAVIKIKPSDSDSPMTPNKRHTTKIITQSKLIIFRNELCFQFIFILLFAKNYFYRKNYYCVPDSFNPFGLLNKPPKPFQADLTQN